MNVVEVTSWEVANFPSFKSIQYSLNEVERMGLVHNQDNIMNSIFVHFDLMQLWEVKANEGSTSYPFEEVTYDSKIPLFLTGNILQLNRSLKKNQVLPWKLKNTPTDYES